MGAFTNQKTEYVMIIELNKIVKNKTKVYSLEYGMGEITRIFKLYDGLEDYFQVSFDNENVMKYYPINSHEKLRIGASLIVLSQALNMLGENISCDDFAFNLNYYNYSTEKLDLAFIVNSIASLTGQSFLDINDQEMLVRLVDSLVLEVSNTYDVSILNARVIVDDRMSCA
jgi:hypothetical protein